MPAGFAVPEWVRLPDELAARGWSRSDLALHAGIAAGAACRAVDGKPIRASTSQKIIRALIEHPMDPAIAAYRRSA